MIDIATFVTILAMAAATYATRILGYLVLRNRVLGPRATAAMEAAPGCVLVSVIAPHFVSDRPSDLIALAATVLAATRLPMLPTVVIGVSVCGCLRHLLA